MPSGSPGSRVSRETRLLLLTVLLSVVALLVLARIRFPERPATPALVPPLLTQLRTPTPFEDLANAVTTLEAEVTPSLQLLTVEQSGAGVPRVVPALRIGPYAAVALVGAASRPVEADLIARDPATGLAVVRTQPARAPERRVWTPQRVEAPRYLLVTEASATGASLRPVFVGALRPTDSYAWRASVWIVPRHLDLARGAFAFTTTGALAGLIVDEHDSQALVPADAVMAAAERLLTSEPVQPGTLGIQVQELTKPIADALRMTAGVVVVHVEPGSPAADRIVATDVIEAMNDEPVAYAHQWRARVARLAAGEQVVLRIRRGTATETVTVKAADAAAAPAQRPLGLTLRSVPGAGAEITLVQPASIASAADLRAGDIITRAGVHAAPSAAQVARAFEALPSGSSVLLAITRGTERLVVALTKP